MNRTASSSIDREERLVAELEQLGVHYLTRQSDLIARLVRLPHKLLANLVQQPSSRVRTALIALLLARPVYGENIPAAMELLTPVQAQTIKFLYTAAVLLQCEYAIPLQANLGADWRWLPDWFSSEFNLPDAPPQEQLKALGRLHQLSSGSALNWAGTYNNAARHLLRRWELEQSWNQ